MLYICIFQAPRPPTFGSDVLCFIGENPGLETSGPGLFFLCLGFGEGEEYVDEG